MPDEATTDSDWRAAHREQLVEKQRHISQKLAQLREFRALVRKWRPLIRQYRDWFSGLENAAESSKWFSLQSVIRMLSITGHLNQLVAEFGQIGDPKSTGSGGASTSTSGPGPATATAAGASTPGSSAGMSDQEVVAATAEVLTARAGPLASMPPWELVHFIDPATSEAVRRGETGVAITNVLCSPFTSLAAVGFAEEIWNMSKELIEEHPEEFEALEEGWNDTKEALDGIAETLDGIDWQEMRRLEEGLEDVLGDYESAYNGARGADETGARQIREAAVGGSTR